ncbi:MAG: ATP-binding cassette domain-containing protein [Eisenbergiella sp.]
MRLEIRNVSYQYKKEDRMILENFNLSVEHTERVGLAAPSGYGKTTLCMLLSGICSQTWRNPPGRKPLHSYRGYCPVQMIYAAELR